MTEFKQWFDSLTEEQQHKFIVSLGDIICKTINWSCNECNLVEDCHMSLENAKEWLFKDECEVDQCNLT